MKKSSLKPYHVNIETATFRNKNYRKVLNTSENMQLVVMNIPPLENIDMEVHNNTDQFIRVEEGQGIAILNGKKKPLKPGSALIIPKGTYHEIVNTTDEPLLLYTIYSPPEHNPSTIQKYKPRK